MFTGLMEHLSQGVFFKLAAVLLAFLIWVVLRLCREKEEIYEKGKLFFWALAIVVFLLFVYGGYLSVQKFGWLSVLIGGVR